MAGTIFLLFKIGDHRYALEGARVMAVLPLLPFKPVPGAPEGIVGMINYRSSPVPVVDLQAMLLQSGTAPWLSTRLFVIRYAQGQGGEERLIALMASMATESIRLNLHDFQPSGITGAPCLGPVISLPRGIVQKIEPEAILTEAVRGALWAAVDAAVEKEAVL